MSRCSKTSVLTIPHLGTTLAMPRVGSLRDPTTYLPCSQLRSFIAMSSPAILTPHKVRRSSLKHAAACPTVMLHLPPPLARPPTTNAFQSYQQPSLQCREQPIGATRPAGERLQRQQHLAGGSLGPTTRLDRLRNRRWDQIGTSFAASASAGRRQQPRETPGAFPIDPLERNACAGCEHRRRVAAEKRTRN